MKHIKLFLVLVLLAFLGNGTAMADYRYNVIAVDDVNMDSTFSGTMTTSSPFSFDYTFSVLDFVINDPLDNVTYNSSNASVTIDNQGFTFSANDGSSSFVLTLYPDYSYFSEFTANGQSTVNNAGFFVFNLQTAAVPEVETSAMLCAGLTLFGLLARRKQKTVAFYA